MESEVKKGQKGLNLSTFHEFSNTPALCRNCKSLRVIRNLFRMVEGRAETLDSPLKPPKFEFTSRTKKKQPLPLAKYV